MAAVVSLEKRGVRVSASVLEEIESGGLDGLVAEELIRWGFDRFAPRIALSAGFGSPDGMVLLDLMHQIDPGRTRVFTLDTGRLPQETYNLIDRVRDRYEIEVEVFFPDPERVQKMVRQHGMNLFYETEEKRKLCCAVRKVEPLERALAGLDAWISGLRPEQSVTRSAVSAVEIDEVHGGRVKLNPLAGWSKDDVWAYVKKHAVPVNALHAQGYPSVGCAPCSRAIREGEDERAGRWWWERPESRECGIHTGYEEEGSGI
ncbi:MAG: phosphoadenylyl-sulfate reductase [Deltaproteobacteria bacterium]|nr:phosphoadenylyl-sulfate reductase [Deltaproteobacteria bacterium]